MSNLSGNEIKLKVLALFENGMSLRDIEAVTGVARSTVSDFVLRKTHQEWWALQGDYKDGNTYRADKVELSWGSAPIPRGFAEGDIIYAEKHRWAKAPHRTTHFVIPDTQVKPGLDLSWLTWVGKYIVDRKPDVIIHLGDHADMPSLSSYDKGKKSFEGRRVAEDIKAAVKGMETLLAPLREYQQKQFDEDGFVSYNPRMVMTIGNHEFRLVRHVEENPELEGFLGIHSLGYENFGWEVHDYLKPVVIDGIAYCHFMANPFTGKPYGGSAMNVLKTVGESFTVGHKQTLDMATRYLPASGRQQWGLICGACYTHDEDYKGYQGNHHFRGVIVKHEVKDGSYNPMFVSLDYLRNRYDRGHVA